MQSRVTVTVTATGMINQADWHGLDEERTGIERGRPEMKMAAMMDIGGSREVQIQLTIEVSQSGRHASKSHQVAAAKWLVSP